MSLAPPAAMTEPTWHRTHLAVPRTDESLLSVPGFGETADAARSNAALLDGCDNDVQGRTLAELRRESRGEALRLARSFTRDVLNDREANADAALPLIVPGHQPALYHPGVWAKNFAAAGIARRAGGAVLNLIVDNDLYARPAIDAPVGTREEPRKRPIPFDAPQRSRPWERAAVKDAAIFRSFGLRAARQMEEWGIDPIAETAWRAACDRLLLGGSIPECLTAARHSAEAAWGLHNLELPMSRLCESDPFLRFAAHLAAHLPRFTEVYNGVLSDYRRLYRIKSKNHPVPPLEARGEWLEAPFWVWRDDAPYRRRVFSRQAGAQTILADDAGRAFATLPLTPTMDACCAVEVLRGLPSQGIRFRTRALTTTLFARLFLADAFVHGIGGSKYDEMTDRVIARFFGTDAPRYATVSASLYLPFAEPFDATGEDEGRLIALLRDLEQNPQRHLARGTTRELDRLLDDRATLVAEQDAARQASSLSRRERRDRSPGNALRFRRLREVTMRLAAFTADQRNRVRDELSGIRKARRANGVLASREFSFALYPEEKLRPFLMGLV